MCKKLPMETHNILILVKVEELSSSDSKGIKVADIGVVEYEFDDDREFYITKIDQTIEKGKVYRISMDFVSALNDNLKGFYRSSFKTKEGETK